MGRPVVQNISLGSMFDMNLERLELYQKEAQHSLAILMSMIDYDINTNNLNLLIFKWPDVTNAYLKYIVTGDASHLQVAEKDLEELIMKPIIGIAKTLVIMVDDSKIEEKLRNIINEIHEEVIERKRNLILLINDLFKKIETPDAIYPRIVPHCTGGH